MVEPTALSVLVMAIPERVAGAAPQTEDAAVLEPVGTHQVGRRDLRGTTAQNETEHADGNCHGATADHTQAST